MKIKFENIAFFTLLAVLTASLFILKGNTDIVYLILGAFTKGNIDKMEREKY